MNARRMVTVSLILVAVLVFVMSTARRTAVDVFFQHVDVAPPDTIQTGPGAAQSIIAFTIDPETNTTAEIDVTPPPPPPPPPPTRTDTTTVRPDTTRSDPAPDLDVDELVEHEAAPKGGPAATGLAAVPPRPIEITWPETRQLKQCIGQSVNVRIWVSEQGTVKDAQVVPGGVLPACADAALVAARHIRFEPGRQGGVPVTMWTEVRIDFQKRD